jgi:hypothetical protein
MASDANIRPGLRLFQIRPQARGVALIVEVDLKKLPGPSGDAAAATIPGTPISTLASPGQFR